MIDVLTRTDVSPLLPQNTVWAMPVREHPERDFEFIPLPPSGEPAEPITVESCLSSLSARPFRTLNRREIETGLLEAGYDFEPRALSAPNGYTARNTGGRHALPLSTEVRSIVRHSWQKITKCAGLLAAKHVEVTGEIPNFEAA